MSMHTPSRSPVEPRRRIIVELTAQEVALLERLQPAYATKRATVTAALAALARQNNIYGTTRIH